MKKLYRTQSSIGKARHVVSFHDGIKTHADGSPFFDTAIFRNKKRRDEFIEGLKGAGYAPA